MMVIYHSILQYHHWDTNVSGGSKPVLKYRQNFLLELVDMGLYLEKLCIVYFEKINSSYTYRILMIPSF